MSEFSCIGLIGRIGSEDIHFSLQRLISYLNKQEVEILIDEATSAALPNTTMPIVSRKQLAKKCDLIIVVGGDGSLLGAARFFAGTKIKILGINRGRLGFLTDISPEEIEYKVGDVLEGKYQEDERSLLTAKLLRDDKEVFSCDALNDVVVHPGKFIRMIEFELYIDEHFVYRQRSDGLIISSPTGSTAYALSGGGSILHPHLDAIALVPMNPHTLSSRPIVVHGNSNITLVISEQNNLEPHVTCDGQIHVVSSPGDRVVISKAKKKLHLIHPEGHNFYETCRTKLGWASTTGSP
ncbi:MAG: NAD(+) kinase [Alteromonadaceae bacterium]|nr:MAG: NAD(+) kinase [Alteromonadaceae bacterium]